MQRVRRLYLGLLAGLALTLLAAPIVPVTRTALVERVEPLFSVYYDGEALWGGEGADYLGGSSSSHLPRWKGYYVAKFIDVKGKVNCTIEVAVEISATLVTEPYEPVPWEELMYLGTERAGTYDFFVFTVSSALGPLRPPTNDTSRLIFEATNKFEHVYIAAPTLDLPVHYVVQSPNGTVRWRPEVLLEVSRLKERALTLSVPANETDYYVFYLSTWWLDVANVTFAAELRYYAFVEEVEWVSLLQLLYEYLGGRP